MSRRPGSTLLDWPTAVSAIPTPFLLVDVEAMERNIARAARLARGVGLRPHFKAHKCTRILERQLAAGGCSGVTCATAAEAKILAEAGFPDILVANEVVHPAALAELAAAAGRTSVTVAVDCEDHVNRLEATASEHRCRFGVLLDLDVGQGRCGMVPGSDTVLHVAQRVARSETLTLEGLMGYDGHAQHRGYRERTDITVRTGALLDVERRRLDAIGLSPRVVSGGGTGTLEPAADNSVLTEIQAGSYVLMDADYGRVGVPFGPALYCVATVISRRSAAEAVADAGLKALSAEDGMPVAVDPLIDVVGISDEHVTLRTDTASRLSVGDALALIPRHVDPTVNLHGTLHALHEDDRVERWAVDGRVDR
jgi:D-serine deaminase-like pyridoxal phosphate-dependent protein